MQLPNDLVESRTISIVGLIMSAKFEAGIPAAVKITMVISLC
jgi:hypothetical protein